LHSHAVLRKLSSLSITNCDRIQSVLRLSVFIYSRCTAQDLSGRAFIPAHHAKRAPLLSLSRARFHHHPHYRRSESVVLCRSNQRPQFLWYRRRNACSSDQCGFAQRLHIWLSFAAPLGRRISRSILQVSDLLSCLCLCELFQSPPHDVGVAQFVLGRLLRSLRAPLLNGRVDGLENPMKKARVSFRDARSYTVAILLRRR